MTSGGEWPESLATGGPLNASCLGMLPVRLVQSLLRSRCDTTIIVQAGSLHLLLPGLLGLPYIVLQLRSSGTSECIRL